MGHRAFGGIHYPGMPIPMALTRRFARGWLGAQISSIGWATVAVIPSLRLYRWDGGGGNLARGAVGYRERLGAPDIDPDARLTWRCQQIGRVDVSSLHRPGH